MRKRQHSPPRSVDARAAAPHAGARFTDKMRRNAIAHGSELPRATRVPTELSLNFSNRSVLCDAVQFEKCTAFRDIQPEIMLQMAQTFLPGVLKYAQPHQHAQLKRLVKDTLTSSNAGNYYSLEATAARLRGLDFEQCCVRCAAHEHVATDEPLLMAVPVPRQRSLHRGHVWQALPPLADLQIHHLLAAQVGATGSRANVSMPGVLGPRSKPVGRARDTDWLASS